MANEYNQPRSPVSAAVLESTTSIDDGWLLDEDSDTGSGAASLAQPSFQPMVAGADLATEEVSPSANDSAVALLSTQRVGGPPPLPGAVASVSREQLAGPPPLPVPAAAAPVRHHPSGGPPPLPVSAGQEFAPGEQRYEAPPPVPRRPSSLPGPQVPKWEREALEIAEAIRLANKA
jgi:hypothetical protein